MSPGIGSPGSVGIEWGSTAGCSRVFAARMERGGFRGCHSLVTSLSGSPCPSATWDQRFACVSVFPGDLLKCRFWCCRSGWGHDSACSASSQVTRMLLACEPHLKEQNLETLLDRCGDWAKMQTLSGHLLHPGSEAPSYWHPGLLGGPLVSSWNHHNVDHAVLYITVCQASAPPGGHLGPWHHDIMTPLPSIGLGKGHPSPVLTKLNCAPCLATAATCHFTKVTLTFLIIQVGTKIGNPHHLPTHWGYKWGHAAPSSLFTHFGFEV